MSRLSEPTPARLTQRALIFLAALTAACASGREAGTTGDPPRLTEAQVQWASGRVIRVGSDPVFAPFSQLDADGTMQGVDRRMLDAIATHTGLKFETVPYRSWTEAWEGFTRGEVEVLTGCAETPSRRERALFSEPYAHPRLAIIGHRDARHAWSVSDLAGLNLAMPRSYVQLEDVIHRVPDVRLSTCVTLPEALKMVASGQADATVISLASAVTLLPQADFKELRVTGFYDRDFPLRFAVSKNLPDLVPVLNDSLNALKHQAAGAAYADWVDARLDEWADQGHQLHRLRSWVGVLAAAVTLLAGLAALGWARARRAAREPASPHDEASPPSPAQVLGWAFDRTSIPMLVVQAPDLIIDRNASARSLFNGTMVLPPELSALAARLAALPPETPEMVAWAPPGQAPVRWQARLLPLSDGRCLLTLVP